MTAHRNQYVERNARLFESAFAGRKYAPTLVVDLDVLQWTMEEFAEKIATFLASSSTPTHEEMTRFLWDLRFQLREIHPSLVDDVANAIDETIGPRKTPHSND